MISDCPIKRPPKKEKEEEEDEENTFDKLFTLSAKEVTPLVHNSCIGYNTNRIGSSSRSLNKRTTQTELTDVVARKS